MEYWHMKKNSLALVAAKVKKQLVDYRPDCCILASAVLMDVLDYLKVPCEPLSVVAEVYNPTMTERMKKEGEPTLEEAQKHWFTYGCWSVGVGHGLDPEAGKWPGHLTVLADHEWMIDLTLDQANRPAHEIIISCPLLIPCNPEFLVGGGCIEGTVRRCFIRYQCKVGDRSFEISNDWRSRKRREKIAGKVIREVRECT